VKSQLAILGGSPVIAQPFPRFNTIDDREASFVSEVLKTGILSAYVGAAGDGFMGGEWVRRLEREAAEQFGVQHAVAVNSWTSGLVAAIGALGLEPGTQVITTPWTMAATATAILHWNCIPVFADIDPNTYNICPRSVERLITDKTGAILAVDIFGLSCDVASLRHLCDTYGLSLVLDSAQAPAARNGDDFAGTCGDIGGLSLNYHKHIHCGEGGILFTNDQKLAQKLCLIRNHGEVVVDSKAPEDLNNMLGFNFRMGEIEASIAVAQLQKLPSIVLARQEAAKRLTERLSGLEGLSTPFVPADFQHVYYVYAMQIDSEITGVSREKIVDALRAEGVPSLASGYQNLHLLPMYQQRIAYGTRGFPWTAFDSGNEVRYGSGSCPVAERLHQSSFIGLNLCMHDYNDSQTELVIQAFEKVWSRLGDLG
jgi:dTDP-4-amino-4,6-dideoxygalactose transaminase